MDETLLEDGEALRVFLNTNRSLYENTVDPKKKIIHLASYVSVLPVQQRNDFFDSLSVKIVRLMAIHNPLLLRQECLRRPQFRKRVIDDLKKSDPSQLVFLYSITNQQNEKNLAYSAAKKSQRVSTFLYFCDMFSEPASVPHLT